VPARHLKARWNVGKSRAPVLRRPRVIVPRIRRLPWAPSTVSRNARDSLLNATPRPIRSFLCRTAVVSARAIYVLVCRHRIGSCEGPDLHIPFLRSTKKEPRFSHRGQVCTQPTRTASMAGRGSATPGVYHGSHEGASVGGIFCGEMPREERRGACSNCIYGPLANGRAPPKFPTVRRAAA
jgi:hypothetical protein